MEVLIQGGVRSSRIVSNQNGTYDIKFEIVNGKSLETNLTYGIQLLPVVNNNLNYYLVADEKVFSQPINLLPNSRTEEEISYTPPPFLSGKFLLQILLKNQSGLTVSSDIVSQVVMTENGLQSSQVLDLIGTSTGITIETSSCNLSVENELLKPKYTLWQGVDILPTESLFLTCKMTNNSSEAVSVNPTFLTYLRSNFNLPLATNNNPNSTLSFGAKESKQASLRLPKPTDPQAYDSVLYLMSGSKSVSNTVVSHWVLRGPSATIQSVKLDRTFYAAGSFANLTFSWTGSADDFPGARIDTPSKLSNLSARAELCGQTALIPLLSGTGSIGYRFSIQEACLTPSVRVTIMSGQKVLSQYQTTIADPRTNKLISKVTIENKPAISLFVTVIIFVAVLVLSIILVRMKKKRNDYYKGIFRSVAILIGATALMYSLSGMSAQITHASTYKYLGTDGQTYTCTYNVNKYHVDAWNPNPPSPGRNTDFKVGNQIYMKASGIDFVSSLPTCTGPDGTVFNTSPFLQYDLQATSTLSDYESQTPTIPSTPLVYNQFSGNHHYYGDYFDVFRLSLIATSDIQTPVTIVQPGQRYRPSGNYIFVSRILLRGPNGSLIGLSTKTSGFTSAIWRTTPLNIGPTFDFTGDVNYNDTGQSTYGVIDPLNGATYNVSLSLFNSSVTAGTIPMTTSVFYAHDNIYYRDEFARNIVGCSNGASYPIYISYKLLDDFGNTVASIAPTATDLTPSVIFWYKLRIQDSAK